MSQHDMGVPTLDSKLLERLLVGVSTGQPEDYEDDLRGLEDLDANYLLHAAVRVGSIAWVDRLLQGKGADPHARVQLVHGLESKHTGDGDKETIPIKLRSTTGISSGRPPLQGHHSNPGESESFECEERHEVASSKFNFDEGVMSRFDALTMDLVSTVESIADMNKSLISAKEAIDSLREDVNSMLSDNARLDGHRMFAEVLTSIKETLKESKSLHSRNAVELDGLKEDHDDFRRELLSMKRSIARIVGESNTETIEETLHGLTSLVEDSLVSESSLHHGSPRDPRNQNKPLARGVTSSTSNSHEHPSMTMPLRRPGHPEQSGRGCVEAMLRMTDIHVGDDAKVARIEGLYEALYTVSPLTSALLEYIQFLPDVRVHIDCESAHIGRMKKTFLDLDGVVKFCGKRRDLADLEEGRIYLGALAMGSGDESIRGFLACSLCCMSTFKAFGNDGRPYEKGNVEKERRYLRLIEELEVLRSNGVDFGSTVNWALDRATRVEREVHAIAAVPKIIACDGPEEGESFLRLHLPKILEFYEDEVVTKLTGDSRHKMALLE